MENTFLGHRGTRASLLQRIRDWQDEASWRQFFEAYSALIYGLGRRLGLTSSEAEDVVQATMMDVAKGIDRFHYDHRHGKFRGWLLNAARWRISEQFDKRLPGECLHSRHTTNARTSTVDRVPSPDAFEADAKTEWREVVLKLAMKRVLHHVKPKHFQIFKLYLEDNRPIREVCSLFNLTSPQVYLIAHRVKQRVRKEVIKAGQELDKAPEITLKT